VVRALDADVGDGRAFEAGEEDSPERISDGGAEAAFEGLGGEFRVLIGGDLMVAQDARGQFETAPTNSHDAFSWDFLGPFWRLA
jgi:hypothetical protein